MEEIIEYIRRNRVSSTQVADCLGKSGSIKDIYPINQGHFQIGLVSWVYAYDESNWSVHEQIQDMKEKTIVLVEDLGCNGRAIFGDIVSKYLILYKQSLALVVTGSLRDAHRLIKENWPIWCCGFNPAGCFNKKPAKPLEASLVEKQRSYYDGSIAVCDDTGVVIIPKEEHNDSFLKKLEFIEEQEDIWYECVDRKKWSTYKTICEKAYLEEKNKLC